MDAERLWVVAAILESGDRASGRVDPEPLHYVERAARLLDAANAFVATKRAPEKPEIEYPI